jgi:O-antigen/teichoic acid export membrane protein
MVMIKPSSLRNIFGYAIGPVISAMLNLITVPALTWIFSQQDIGRLSMLQVTLNFSTVLFCLGLDQSYVREYHEASDKPAVLYAAIMPGLLLLLVCSVIIMLMKPFLISNVLFSIDSSAISFVVLVCLITAYISRFLSLILRMQDRGLAYSMSQITPRAFLLLIVAVYAFYITKQRFRWLLLAQAAALISSAIVFAINTRSQWIPACRRRMDIAKIRSMLNFGAPLILGGLASWALSAMGRVFLRAFSTYAELAVFSVATSATAAVVIFSGVFNTIWAPAVYRRVADGKELREIDEIVEHVLAAIALAVTIIACLSWVVAFVLPKSYAMVPYLLVSCICAPLFYTLSEVTAIGISLSRKTIYSMAASLIAVIISVGVNYILVPIFGALGAATATALAFWVFFVCRTEFASLVWRKMARTKIYATTMVLLIMALIYAFLGQKYTLALIACWVALGVIWIVIFRNSYIKGLNYAYSSAKGRYRRYSASP